MAHSRMQKARAMLRIAEALERIADAMERDQDFKESFSKALIKPADPEPEPVNEGFQDYREGQDGWEVLGEGDQWRKASPNQVRQIEAMIRRRQR